MGDGEMAFWGVRMEAWMGVTIMSPWRWLLIKEGEWDSGSLRSETGHVRQSLQIGYIVLSRALCGLCSIRVYENVYPKYAFVYMLYSVAEKDIYRSS